MSFASALRRHSYTFEELYKTTFFTGIGGMIIYIAVIKYFYHNYFNQGEKYEGDTAMKKECKVCWTLKAYASWLSLSFIVPLSTVFWMAEPNNKYGGNLQMMNDIATKRHWQFWGQVFREERPPQSLRDNRFVRCDGGTHRAQRLQNHRRRRTLSKQNDKILHT